MRLLQRLDRAEGALDLEVLAVEVEGFFGRPGAADDLQVFVGAFVAFGLVQQGVAFLGLGGDAGDGMQADAPTTGGVVEGGEGTGGDGGRGEGRAVGDHEAQALGLRGGVGGDLQAVGAAGAAGDEHPVEAGVLVGAGVVAEKLQVEIPGARAACLGPLAGKIMPTNSMDIVHSLLCCWLRAARAWPARVRTGSPPGP